MAVYVFQLVLAVAAIAASYLLTKSALSKKNKFGDDSPTTLATRGDVIPLIIGTRRTGLIFGLTARRTAKTSSSGGKGGGDNGDGPSNFFEDGWHQICVGPAEAILMIFANNKPIWKTPISRDTSPSGSHFTLPNGQGSFDIYWGDSNQPVHPRLAAYLGHNSCHPYLCYIYWHQKALGMAPTWPQLEYVVRVKCPAVTLQDSAYWITDDDGATGVNLAHAAIQILAAPAPWGIGLPRTAIDNDSAEAFGVLMEFEQIGVNLLLQQGQKAVETLQGLLQDAGVLICQIEGRITFMPIRNITDPVPVIDNDIVTPPNFERTINRGESPASRTLFTYKDEKSYAYRDQDIVFDDDAEIEDTGNSKTTTGTIFSTTSKSMSDRIASRRWQETATKAAFKLTALRAARRISPGQVIDHATFGRLRVMSNQPTDKSPETILEVTPDIYGIASIGDTSSPGAPGEGGTDIAQDLGIAWFELPASLANNQEQIVVFRTRDNQQVIGAQVMGSINSGTYIALGRQDASAAGGLIDQDIAAPTLETLAIGPGFEDSNGDAPDILDLSGDITAWQNGKQLAVIGNEIFYLQSVTLLSETVWTPTTGISVGEYRIPPLSTGMRYVCITAGITGDPAPVWPIVRGEQVSDNTVVWEARYYKYRMNNLIRARYESVQTTHSAGDRVFIIDSANLIKLNSSVLYPGADLCIKTYPFNFTDSTTNSLIVCKTLTGSGYSSSFTTFRITVDGSFRLTTLGESRFIA